ncbi:hypothetical protein PF008_g12098 [Phytophthora fragariae]|uniref:Uncharacterized protein n=1 Tax=Phytophthora fragariae TaxID=53985 RepID=A0A6G0RQB6_9STRA|nr:hypothetical protein PF008_g12098 [Phytophthora fragariae]
MASPPSSLGGAHRTVSIVALVMPSSTRVGALGVVYGCILAGTDGCNWPDPDAGEVGGQKLIIWSKT